VREARKTESVCVCVRKSAGRKDLRMFYLKGRGNPAVGGRGGEGDV